MSLGDLVAKVFSLGLILCLRSKSDGVTASRIKVGSHAVGGCEGWHPFHNPDENII